MNTQLNSLAVDRRGQSPTAAPAIRRTCRLALAAAAAFGAATAHAGCADPRAMRSVQPHVTLHAPAAAAAFRAGPAAREIVGTWLVTYSGGGQAYIQWHADGTEWENINFPIEGGTICMGSWKAVDVDHVARNHFGWLYTNGILTGYFNETETTEVKHDGTYAGITDTRVYDLDGNLQVEFGGTSSAVLIAP